MNSAIRVNFYRPNSNNDQDLELLKSFLDYCKTPKSLREIMEKFEFEQRINFKSKYINPLIEKGKLSFTISDKPFSKNQKYIAK